MIDKKKLTIILGAVGICTIALIVAIVWAVTTLAAKQADNTASGGDPTTTPSIEQTPTETTTPDVVESSDPPTDPAAIPDELLKTAEQAAGTAVVWSGSSSRSALQNRYEAAGFSDDLAQSYESVWATIYTDPAVGRYDDGDESVRAETFASIISSEVRDVRGDPGDRLIVVAVNIHYDAQWTDRDGQIHLAGQGSDSQGDAIWGATVSEKTGKVVQIDNPPLESLVTPKVG